MKFILEPSRNSRGWHLYSSVGYYKSTYHGFFLTKWGATRSANKIARRNKREKIELDFDDV